MSTTPAHQPLITDSDYSPLVNVLNWILIVISSLCIVSRMVIKFSVSTPALDDALIFVSLLFTAAMCATASLQANNGLGQHQDTLSDAQLQDYQKEAYGFDLCFVLAMVASKLSIVMFLKAVAPHGIENKLRIGLGIAIAVWGVVTFIAAAFQCPPPETWLLLSSRCYDTTAFWSFFAGSSIFLEVLLTALPISVLRNIQVGLAKRIAVTACFSARVLVILASAVQLFYLNNSRGATDVTFTTWPAVICTLFVQHVSLVTACVPYLKPMLLGFQSGMIRTDDLRRREASVPGMYDYLKPTRGAGRKNETNSSGKSRKSLRSDLAMDSIARRTTDRTTTATRGPVESQNWDRESQASQSKMIRVDHAYEITRE